MVRVHTRFLMMTSRVGFIWLGLGLGALGFLTDSTFAQSGKPVNVPSNARPKSEATRASEPNRAGLDAARDTPRVTSGVSSPLADEVFRIDSVGLTMRLPAGTIAGSSQMGGRTAASIGPADGSWAMNIQLPVTGSPSATVQQALEQTIALIQGSVGILDPDQTQVLSTEAKIIERIDRLQLVGGDAARLYISLPEPSNRGRVVKGYTIFKPSATQYVVFEVVSPEATFPKVRGLYEMSVATAEFISGNELQLRRMTAIKAGNNFISQLSQEDIVSAMAPEGQERWYRMYKPSLDGNSGGEKELGYYGMTFWRGVRGEITQGRAASTFTEAEKQEGYLIRVRSRIINERIIADNVGVFFMTPDRKQESWVFTTAARDLEGKQQAVASETGARFGNDLQIVKSEPGKPTTTVQPPILGEGYISQFETFVLPRLLAMKGIEGEYGSYAYQAWPAGTITFRRDIAKAMNTPKGRYMRISSILREDSPEQLSSFDATGELLGIEFADGTMRVPTDPAALKRLWQQKGLPTDK